MFRVLSYCHLYYDFFHRRMKNVIIRNTYAVGMHHSGVKQLKVGPLYFCSKEPSNPRDPNAVAVYADESLRRRVCYLRREDALKLKDILTFVQGPCYLRAKMWLESFPTLRDPSKTAAMASNAMTPTLNAWQLCWMAFLYINNTDSFYNTRVQ